MSRQGYIYNKANSNETATILINGEISDWWGVGLESFAKDIENADAKEIVLQINSVGGSVTEGTAIAAYIKGSPSNINTSILGLCASIATTIAIAGKSTSIAKGSLFMIHNASGSAWGGSDEMRKTADLLDTIDMQLTDIYLDVIEANGKLINDSREETRTQLIDWQNNETWFTAEQAVEHGFIQNLVEGVEFSNKFQAQEILNSCSKYKNVPTDFINNIQNIVNMADNKPTNNDAQEKQTLWESVKAMFASDEGKALVAKGVKEAQASEAQALEAAKELLAANGLSVVAKEEEKAPVVVEEEKEDEVQTELEILQAKLKASELKAQKLQEEAQGAPSAKAKELKANKTSIFTKEEMEGFAAITNSIKNR